MAIGLLALFGSVITHLHNISKLGRFITLEVFLVSKGVILYNCRRDIGKGLSDLVAGKTPVNRVTNRNGISAYREADIHLMPERFKSN
jgi:hypothetical protein